MRLQRGDVLAALTLVVLLLTCFWRLVGHPSWLIVDGERRSLDFAFRDDVRVVGNDLTALFLPHYAHVAAEVARHGRLPQWDRSGFAGRPMVGNPQGGLFYPPVWLALWSQAPAALGWLTVGHLIWAGLGTYVLSRSLDAGRFASTIAASGFIASPYVLAHAFEGHYPHVWCASWYPWAFWAYGQLRRGRWPGVAALPPTLAASFLAGHPQESYYLVFALSVWALIDALHAAWSGRAGAAALRWTTWLGIIGLTVGLIAVELLPDLASQEWALRTSRLALGKVSHYQLHPLNLFQLLDPFALGGPSDYFGNDNYWETVLSIGLVPLALALAAVLRHPDRRLVHGLMLLVGAAVLFAAGRSFGFFTLLFELVPGMNRFRVPSRSLFLASLGAALLAGLGVETLARAAARQADWRWLARRSGKTALVIVLSLLVLGSIAHRDERLPTIPRSSGLLTPRAMRSVLRGPTGLRVRTAFAASRVLGSPTFWMGLGGTLGMLVLGVRRQGLRPLLPASIGLLAVVELAIHGQALMQVAPPGLFLGPDPISEALARLAPAREGPFRIRARDILFQDARARSNGIEKININDSFQVQHAADLYQKLYPLLYVQSLPDPGDYMGDVVAQYRRVVSQGVLDRMNVAFLVSDHVESEPAWPLVASGSWKGSAYAIHRNPSALPRAYVVPRAAICLGGAKAVISQFRLIDPRAAVVMASDPLSPDGPRQAFRPARWIDAGSDRVLVEAETEAPGLLVVADTWMPGWTATVDGLPAPIFRGNHAQRVVALPSPGRHQIEMRYEAPGLARGMAITLISVLAWGAVSVNLARRSTSRGTRTDQARTRVPLTLSRPRRPAGAIIGISTPCEEGESEMSLEVVESFSQERSPITPALTPPSQGGETD